jgi:CheY-like chemotaxis protein
MPILDGISAIEQLRSDPQFANLPIIVLALPETKDLELYLKAGASHHLTKPITFQLLVATIQDLSTHV